MEWQRLAAIPNDEFNAILAAGDLKTMKRAANMVARGGSLDAFIAIPKALLPLVKEAAASEGVPIRTWVTRAILQALEAPRGHVVASVANGEGDKAT